MPEKAAPEKQSARGLLQESASALASAVGGDALFFSRFGFRYETIVAAFRALYGTVPGADGYLERLAALLLDCYRDRPDRLKESDRKRERDHARGKAWFQEPGLTAYMAYVDRFARDLDGFRLRLPWLRELGIDIVHLMPFFRSHAGNNDGGYAISDYLGVDPRLGDRASLARLADELHEKGMFLAADLVLNHSSEDHAWALAAKAGDEKYKGYYYVFPDREMPDRFESAMPQVFPETAPGNFSFVPELDAWVMTVFHDFQWDLNWSNPEVFLEMLKVLLGLANRGVDLLRLDAVPYLWKKPGTSCQNLEEAHIIVRLLKACADVVAPGVAFLAEAIVQPSEIVRYLDSGGTAGESRVEECQLAYHASLMALLWEALATRKVGLLSATFGSETRLPPGTAWLSYVRCHDDIGLGYDETKIREVGFTPGPHRRFLLDFYSGRFPGSFARGRLFMENPVTGDARISGTCASLCGLEAAVDEESVELALRRIELLYGLVSSLVGIPMVFSGDELASLNDYSYQSDEEHAEDNRWMHRPRMDWEAAGRCAESGTREARIFGSIRRFFSLRRDIPAFAQDAGFRVLASGSENVLLVQRCPGSGDERRVAVAANFAPEERAFPLAALGPGFGQSPLDLLTGGEVKAFGGMAILPAYGLSWLAEA
jgi:amylosucrase